MKKIFAASLLSTALLFSVSTNIFASTNTLAQTEVSPLGVEVPDISTSFSKVLKKNAAYIAYYALNEKPLGTYPLATGEYFAKQVKTGGPWDYKLEYGVNTPYKFLGATRTGEDLGNIHYGYVGRGAGFSATILKTAAGAYQIYSGTAHLGWYDTYFDDPRDQKMIINGIDLWDNDSLAKMMTLADTLTPEEKKEIEEQVKLDVARIKAEKSKEMNQN